MSFLDLIFSTAKYKLSLEVVNGTLMARLYFDFNY